VNVAGGRRIALNALVTEIGRVLGRSVEVVQAPPRSGDIRHSLGDISRAAELFGYAPEVRWEDGIAPTIQYLTTLRDKGLAAASGVMAALWS
jgi:nucleoside-diphosphate-sugar epimerase